MKTRLLALALPLLAVGCHDTAKSAREDAKDAAEDVRKAVQEAAKDAKDAAHDASREAHQAAEGARHDVREAMGETRAALRDAGREMREAGRDAGREMREAGREVHEAKQLVDVRAALGLSDEISSASDIDVRADEAGRRVYLEGQVATDTERVAAERIARDAADGFRIVNRLRVMAR